MSLVWNKLIEIQNYFIKEFSYSGIEINEPGMERFNQPGWINRVWTSETYRRAHVDVVDARDTKGLWMMHCCVFPHTDDLSPIFGYDVIAGKNKITGFFHDFSSTGDDSHPMMLWFEQQSKNLAWKKTRELPEWARNIFSDSMIAAGNVSDEQELEQIYQTVFSSLTYYLDSVGTTRGEILDNTNEQNYYCENQKKNPHTPRVMTSLGLNESDVTTFIQDCLFPDIKKI
jgi:phycocyanobilin:ferredoxin oxidoreductase